MFGLSREYQGPERKKEARTNIRIEPNDLEAIRKKAQEKGLGYQTLIASVIQMYVNDQLLEVNEVKKMLASGMIDRKKIS